MMKKGRKLNENIGSKNLHHFVQRLLDRAIRQTACRKATGPDEVLVELFEAGGEAVLEKMHRICVAIWETNEWPDSSHFPRKVILNSMQITEQLLLFHMQARSFFGSYWIGFQ